MEQFRDSSSRIKLYIKEELLAIQMINFNPLVRDIICLNNQKCVILFNSPDPVCRVIDLEGENKGGYVDVKAKQNALKLYQLNQGFCVQTHECFQVFDRNYNEKVIPISEITLNRLNNNKIEEFLTTLNHPEWSPCQNNKQPKYMLADENEWLITDSNSSSTSLYNLRTKQTRQLDLPYPDIHQRKYLIKQNQGICMRRLNGTLELWMIQFKIDGESKKLNNIPGQSFIRFDKINKEKRLIMFSNYSEVIIYNYEEEKIVSRWKVALVDFGKRTSDDFRHCVDVKRKENDIYVVHLKGLPETKKIVMNILEKSNLTRAYGEGLMQMIMRIIDH